MPRGMESFGRIDPFPLGTKDASDGLLIPANGTPELVHLFGYSGIGKSSQDANFGMRVFWLVLGTASAAIGWELLTILMR
jgi:hypothetical protein